MVGQHHGVEYCDKFDIDNINFGAGRISRRRHVQRDAGQAMDFLLMDCASVHISKEYSAAMQEQWPHVKLVCVPANFTAVAQHP